MKHHYGDQRRGPRSRFRDRHYTSNSESFRRAARVLAEQWLRDVGSAEPYASAIVRRPHPDIAEVKHQMGFLDRTLDGSRSGHFDPSPQLTEWLKNMGFNGTPYSTRAVLIRPTESAGEGVYRHAEPVLVLGVGLRQPAGATQIYLSVSPKEGEDVPTLPRHISMLGPNDLDPTILTERFVATGNNDQLMSTGPEVYDIVQLNVRSAPMTVS